MDTPLRPALAEWPQGLVGAILGGKRDLRKLATFFVEWAAKTSVERFGTDQLREGYRQILAAQPEQRCVAAKKLWFDVGAQCEQFAVKNPGSAFTVAFAGAMSRHTRADDVAHGIWLTTLDQTIVGEPGEALRYFAKAGLTWEEQAVRLMAILVGPWEETERA
jgi:hypothetical protein